jgi:membrane protein DedA with SNARE-associated domain
MSLSLETILMLLTQYGYVFLFLIAVIEGPIITVLGGFLAAQGVFNVYSVFLVVFLGDLAGDAIYYFLGKMGTKFKSWIPIKGLTDERIDAIKEQFHQHLGKTLFFAKYTQTGFLALPAAGALDIPFAKFIWYNALSTIPKSVLLVALGYFFGYAYARINTDLKIVSAAIVVLVGLGTAYYVYVHRKK